MKDIHLLVSMDAVPPLSFINHRNFVKRLVSPELAVRGGLIVNMGHVVDQGSDPVSSVSTLVPGPVHEAKVSVRSGLAGKPESVDVGSEILVSFPRHTHGPVAVAPVRPSAEHNR